jgi:hypothetical protein
VAFHFQGIFLERLLLIAEVILLATLWYFYRYIKKVSSIQLIFILQIIYIILVSPVTFILRFL